MLLAHPGPPSFLMPFLHSPFATRTTSCKARISPLTPLSVRRYARVASVPRDGPSDSASDDSTSSPSTSSSTEFRNKAYSPHGQGQATRIAGDPEQWTFPTKPNPSPFEVMHLPRSADASEIKKQYYKLAMLYHPDSSHPASCTDHFNALNKAYNLLSSDSSRARYLRTGMGWSASAPEPATGFSWRDAEMLRQARHRAHYSRSQAAAGAGAGRGEAAYDRMRWGYDAEDIPKAGSGEGVYMSHQQFFGALSILALLFAFVQYNRALSAADSARELVERRHMGASQALAEARQEAALYGRERRERIRRIVRSLEVQRDYENRLAEAAAVQQQPQHEQPTV